MPNFSSKRSSAPHNKDLQVRHSKLYILCDSLLLTKIAGPFESKLLLLLLLLMLVETGVGRVGIIGIGMMGTEGEDEVVEIEVTEVEVTEVDIVEVEIADGEEAEVGRLTMPSFCNSG